MYNYQHLSLRPLFGFFEWLLKTGFTVMSNIENEVSFARTSIEVPNSKASTEAIKIQLYLTRMSATSDNLQGFPQLISTNITYRIIHLHYVHFIFNIKTLYTDLHPNFQFIDKFIVCLSIIILVISVMA